MIIYIIITHESGCWVEPSRIMVDGIGGRVPLYYTATWRGLIQGLHFAVNTHWRIVAGAGSGSELDRCGALALGLYQAWDTLIQPIMVSNVTMTKVSVLGYNDPEAFYEQPAALTGELVVQSCPPFVALGFRQLRSNRNFRASTHRFPGVPEENNVNGSFVETGGVDYAKLALVSNFLRSDHEFPIGDTLSTTFRPVLVRTQTTTGSDRNPPKVVTALIPHEICDVADSGFYGITSQVSRKAIAFPA